MCESFLIFVRGCLSARVALQVNHGAADVLFHSGNSGVPTPKAAPKWPPIRRLPGAPELLRYMKQLTQNFLGLLWVLVAMFALFCIRMENIGTLHGITFFFEFWTHAATKLCKRALETKPQEPLILLIAYSDPWSNLLALNGLRSSLCNFIRKTWFTGSGYARLHYMPQLPSH